MTTYRYRPALAAAPAVYQLDGSILDPGTADKIDLAAVTTLHFVQHRLGDTTFRRLDIGVGETRHGIGLTLASAALPDSADATTHRTLLAEVARTVAQAQPALAVTIGEHGWARRVLFGIGILSVGAAVAIFGAALAGGVGAARLAEAASPLGLLALVGIGLAGLFRPGQPLPRMSVGDFVTLLDALDQPVGRR